MSSNRPLATLALAALLGGAVGGIATALVLGGGNTGSPGSAPRTGARDPGSTTELLDRLDLVEQRLALSSRVADDAEITRRPLPSTDAGLRKLVSQLVAQEFASLRAASEQPDNSAGGAGDGYDVDRALVDLLAATDDGQRFQLWEQARQAGKVEELVEEFERRAEANPTSPDARVDLGLAYVQKLLSITDPAAQMKAGQQADTAFTRALELDPNHWGARFRKAEGLAHQPAASGKHGEAIRHFETLLQQQRASPPRAEFASTYHYLASLYEQRGRHEEARELRERGLRLHPGDTRLRSSLGR